MTIDRKQARRKYERPHAGSVREVAGVNPVAIRAHYGAGFHHPHLQTGTAGDWPLNVFDEEQAAAELPTLRAMASADFHNVVFQLGDDWRIVPAMLNRQT